ncbi:hypothetical protein ON010_g17425 [Phytophthora cinnamomi]|nr:hypothetical protein ON010_g17425 [Phytophthora cinnamomi]
MDPVVVVVAAAAGNPLRRFPAEAAAFACTLCDAVSALHNARLATAAGSAVRLRMAARRRRAADLISAQATRSGARPSDGGAGATMDFRSRSTGSPRTSRLLPAHKRRAY